MVSSIYKNWLARPAIAMTDPRKTLELADKLEPAPVDCGESAPVPVELAPVPVELPEPVELVADPLTQTASSSSSSSKEAAASVEVLVTLVAEPVLDGEVEVEVAVGRAVSC